MKTFKLTYIIVCAICIAFVTLTKINNSHAFSIEDYYPSGQGDLWTYKETRDGSSSILTNYIDGYKSVDYGYGNTYYGYVNYGIGDGRLDYNVEKISSRGIEEIKLFNANNGSYTLFGTPGSSSPNSPYVQAPSSFNIGGIFENNLREFKYSSSGTLTQTIDRSFKLTFQGFEDVRVEGGYFRDGLKIKSEETIIGSNGWEKVSEGVAYLAPDIGIVKQIQTATITDSNGSHVENMTSELVRAEISGYNYGKPEYPIVLVHGLDGSGEESYYETPESTSLKKGTWATLEQYFRNVGLKDGGTINVYMNDENISNLTLNDVTNPSSKGDYYTINFVRTGPSYADPGQTASPGNEDSITKQGKGLGLAISKILDETDASKVTLVGYSMGGLAAREYLEGQNYSQLNNVDQLITIGTPNNGSFAARLASQREAGEISFNDFKNALKPYYGPVDATATALFNGLIVNDKDINGNAIRDLRDDSVYLNGGQEQNTPSYFENDYINVDGDSNDTITGLFQKSLPGGVKYTSLYSQFFRNVPMPNDGVSTASSQKMPLGNYIEMWKPGLISGIFHDQEPKDIADILRALGYKIIDIRTSSPIDLIITDPNGIQIDKNTIDMFGVYYLENDFDSDGINEPWVTIMNPLDGNYRIQVIPRLGASLFDTYSLGVTYNDNPFLLAENVLIKDIPETQYYFDTRSANNVIPEPNTFMLFACGVAGVLFGLKNKKQVKTKL